MSERKDGFVPPTEEAVAKAVAGIRADIDAAIAKKEKIEAEARKARKPLPSPNMIDYTVNSQIEADPVQVAIDNSLASGLLAQRSMAGTFKRISPSYVKASKVSRIDY